MLSFATRDDHNPYCQHLRIIEIILCDQHYCCSPHALLHAQRRRNPKHLSYSITVKGTTRESLLTTGGR